MSAIALGRHAPAPIAARDWLASAAAHGVLLAALAWWAASVDDPHVPTAPVPIRWAEAAAETPPVAAAPVAEPSPPARSTQPARSPRARSERSVDESTRVPARPHVATPAAPAPAPAAAVEPTAPASSESFLAASADTAPASPAPPIAAPTRAGATIPRAPSITAPPSRWRSDFEALLLAQKRYPRQARRLGQQGIVTVHAQFAADGELLGCEVAASSGFRALDEAAVELVRIAAGQLRTTSAPGSRAELRIPIAYELNGRGT